MRSVVAFQTESGNRYIYDRGAKSLMLCHPLLYLMAELERKGIDVALWLKGARQLPFHFDVALTDFDDSEILHYLDEWMLLKKSDTLAQPGKRQCFSRRLTELDVAHSLANTRHVCFETTEACNLDCTYCSYGEFYAGFDGRTNRRLDPTTAKKLLGYLEDRWTSPQNTNPNCAVRLSFFGGEPLVNAAFIEEAVNYARASEFLKDRIKFSMTTNGTLLIRNMDLLVSNSFETTVSLDGNRRNDSYRVYKNGLPSFDEVMKNLDALRSAHPKYFEEKVQFNAVMHNRNSVAEVHGFFKEKFGKVPILSSLDTAGVKESKSCEFQDIRLNVVQSLADSDNRRAIERDLHASLPITRKLTGFVNEQLDFSATTYQDLVWPESGADRIPTGTCIPFTKKLYVTVTGKILPCEKISHDFTLGRVTENGVDLDCGAIADQYNGLYDQMSRQCDRCYTANSCGHCLFKQLGPDGLECRSFMNYDRYAEHLSVLVSHVEANPESYSEALNTVVM